MEKNRKNVLITGSSSGLGKETARVFARNNYNVIVTYLSHEDEALSLKNLSSVRHDKWGFCKMEDKNLVQVHSMLSSSHVPDIVQYLNMLSALVSLLTALVFC